MDISQDKIDLLEKLELGKAFVISGEAGTGKTLAGLLCGKKLLKYLKPWQKVLYLTYSKLAKRQISETMLKLRSDSLLEDELARRMEVLNYHSLWWNLICRYYCFLEISGQPELSTLREVKERAEKALEEAKDQEIIPSYYRRKSNGGINERKIDDLVAVLGGSACVYAQWGPEYFGNQAKHFIKEKAFLSWAEAKILSWNRKGLFWHDETIYWAHLLLKKHPNVLNIMKVRYPIVIIDEFQDTDVAQWEMVQLFAPETIIVMADMKQTIHIWRGSNPRRVEQFKEWCNKCNKYGVVEEIKLRKKHRATRVMSECNNINWVEIDVKDSSGRQKLALLKARNNIKCKSLVRNRLGRSEKGSIAVLCLTNNLADDITNYLRRTQPLKNRGKIWPIKCDRLGVENSPYEKGRDIILILVDMMNGKQVSSEYLQDYISNKLLPELLPQLSKKKLPTCSKQSRGKNKERWMSAGIVAQTIVEDIGSGLTILRRYIRDQSKAYDCHCDNLTASCIGYVGKVVQRVGKRVWSNLSKEEKRRKIDSIIIQYENISSATRNERVSIMTVHQSKGREFDTVIIPWFSNVDLSGGDYGRWDTSNIETVNLFHTACERAKNEVIVITPKGYKATWPPETNSFKNNIILPIGIY